MRLPLSLGPTLTLCVRVRSDTMLVDGGADGEIPSKAGKMKPLQQGDDGFACFRSRGDSIRRPFRGRQSPSSSPQPS